MLRAQEWKDAAREGHKRLAEARAAHTDAVKQAASSDKAKLAQDETVDKVCVRACVRPCSVFDGILRCC